MAWTHQQLRFYLQDIKIPKNIIEEIVQLFKEKSLDKDSYFATEGEVSDRLGFICNGCFVMFTSNLSGDLDVKEFIGPNNFLVGTLNTKINMASIQALTDSILLEASYTEVRKLYDAHPVLDTLAKKAVEQRINTICEQLFELKNKTAAERYLLFKERYSALEQYIPQFLVASFLGITPTQLSRIRSKMSQNQHM